MNRLLSVLAVIAVAAVAYLSFDWAVGAVIHNRRVVMVPDLSGKSPVEALNLLSQTRLGLTKEGEQFDKHFPAGTIIRQNPTAGMTTREGRMVRVTLSQGGETLFVPDLVSQPLRNAQATLQNTGLGVGEVERKPSLRFEKDVVMSTDPPGNAIVNKNALINLIVSEGPPASDVLLAPDFIGQTVSDAKAWAAAHQLSVSVREESDISKPAGQILQQTPNPDTPLGPGESITVVSNNGTGGPSADGPRIHFEVPQGASDRDIRIRVMDETGEREVFRRAQSPGSKVDLNVSAKGRARARIFVNGVMVEEQEIQ